MKRGAVLSDCGRFRYHLWRVWGADKPLVFVMLNPSTADADLDDPTIRRCIGFAQTLGFGGIEVVNLFAFRATKPTDLRAARWPIGDHNDSWIRTAAANAIETGGAVCCAWGAQAGKLARPAEVLALLTLEGVDAQCLELTRGGHPAHPLYLPGATHLRPLP